MSLLPTGFEIEYPNALHLMQTTQRKQAFYRFHFFRQLMGSRFEMPEQEHNTKQTTGSKPKKQYGEHILREYIPSLNKVLTSLVRVQSLSLLQWFMSFCTRPADCIAGWRGWRSSHKRIPNRPYSILPPALGVGLRGCLHCCHNRTLRNRF